MHTSVPYIFSASSPHQKRRGGQEKHNTQNTKGEKKRKLVVL